MNKSRTDDPESYEALEMDYALMQDERNSLAGALQAIANMRTIGTTDHAQLSALCIAVARQALRQIGIAP